jgi:hypothetical protein
VSILDRQAERPSNRKERRHAAKRARRSISPDEARETRERAIVKDRRDHCESALLIASIALSESERGRTFTRETFDSMRNHESALDAGLVGGSPSC